jgi:hypothetical protein
VIKKLNPKFFNTNLNFHFLVKKAQKIISTTIIRFMVLKFVITTENNPIANKKLTKKLLKSDSTENILSCNKIIENTMKQIMTSSIFCCLN